MIHELKTWPAPFQALVEGAKTFEFRKNDRGFEVGDTLRLLEFDPIIARYTRRETHCDVTYLLRGPAFGLPKGYVVMAVKLRPEIDDGGR